MATKRVRHNFRVEVRPWFTALSESQMMLRCKRIEESIRRHVDDVGVVEVRCDTMVVCEHCGHKWEIDDDGAPLCCNAAVDEWEAARKAGA